MAQGMRLEIDPRSIHDAARVAHTAATRGIAPAIIEALTVVALRARKAERENMVATLDRPTGFTLDSVVAKPATRQPDGSLQSSIYVRAAMVAILYRLEYGGVVEAGLAIIDHTLENQYGSLGLGGVRRVINLPGAFQGEFGGQRGVYQRDPNTGRLKLLVAYVDQAEYRPMLGYNDTAEKVGQTFNAEVERQVHKRLQAAGYR